MLVSQLKQQFSQYLNSVALWNRPEEVDRFVAAAAGSASAGSEDDVNVVSARGNGRKPKKSSHQETKNPSRVTQTSNFSLLPVANSCYSVWSSRIYRRLVNSLNYLVTYLGGCEKHLVWTSVLFQVYERITKQMA